MNAIGERIKMIIDSERLNEYSFSKRIGKSNTAIAKIVKGESKPGFEIIEAVLVEFPNINSDWLIHGTGQMTKDGQRETGKSGSYLQEYLQKLEERFEKLTEQLTVKDKQIDKLMDLLGKPLDVVEETQVLPLWLEIQARA